MKKEIKVGDVYFKNDILEVTYINGYYPGHFMYKMDFLGHISEYSCSKEHIDETIKKRLDAYDLIPVNCFVIPKHLVCKFKGKLIGGVMEDSIKIVYGVAESEIRGFSCSIFFIPNEEILENILCNINLQDEFKIKL